MRIVEAPQLMYVVSETPQVLYETPQLLHDAPVQPAVGGRLCLIYRPYMSYISALYAVGGRLCRAFTCTCACQAEGHAVSEGGHVEDPFCDDKADLYAYNSLRVIALVNLTCTHTTLRGMALDLH